MRIYSTRISCITFAEFLYAISPHFYPELLATFSRATGLIKAEITFNEDGKLQIQATHRLTALSRPVPSNYLLWRASKLYPRLVKR